MLGTAALAGRPGGRYHEELLDSRYDDRAVLQCSAYGADHCRAAEDRPVVRTSGRPGPVPE